MSEYWIISAPGDKTCQQTWETMNNVTNKQNNLCDNFKMHIPDLKVGTLDQLVGLSDDLGKLDTFVEQITRKLAAYLGEVLEDQRDKLQENLLANNSEFKTISMQIWIVFVRVIRHTNIILVWTYLKNPTIRVFSGNFYYLTLIYLPELFYFTFICIHATSFV